MPSRTIEPAGLQEGGRPVKGVSLRTVVGRDPRERMLLYLKDKGRRRVVGEREPKKGGREKISCESPISLDRSKQKEGGIREVNSV